MANIRKCYFNSVWDGESVVITTDAKIDLDSGRVFDIEPADGVDDEQAEVETLDREYIDFDGIGAEFEVEAGQDGDYYTVDLQSVLSMTEVKPTNQPGL